MSALKRFSLILLFFLIILSVMDDLSKPKSVTHDKPSESNVHTDYQIAHIKVKPGDTVLSITESINEMDELDIDKIVSDFEYLNPGTTSETIIPHSFYYFPLYNDF